MILLRGTGTGFLVNDTNVLLINPGNIDTMQVSIDLDIRYLVQIYRIPANGFFNDLPYQGNYYY